MNKLKTITDIKDILRRCEVCQSTLTRTGRFYKLDGRVILEYMTSTKNVWVDNEISELIPKDKLKAVEQDIRDFFNGSVKNVSFDLSMNEHIDTFNGKMNDVLTLCKTQEERDQMEILVKSFFK
jgi:hypothetical protein